MHVPCRSTHLLGALLLAAASAVGAESPLPDPIAPAVIGRPLDEIGPVRPQRQKATVAKPDRRGKQVGAHGKADRARKATAVSGAAAAVAPRPAQPAQAPQAAAVQGSRQALDGQVATPAPLLDNVGQGTRVSSQGLAPGAYFNKRAQALVRKYYDAHPSPRKGPGWKIGEAVPAKAAMTGVPDDVRAALPKVPPGHQYVQLDGEVVLVAVQSRMVVDGIARAPR